MITVESTRKILGKAGEGLGVEPVDRRNDVGFVHGDSCFLQVGQNLGTDMSSAGPLQVQSHQPLGVGIGLGRGHLHVLRGPEAEQPGAPTLRLEPQLFIQLILRLMTTFDFSKGILHA